jgi:hypothetical protein
MITPTSPEWLAEYALGRRWESAYDSGFPRFYCETLCLEVVRDLRAIGVQHVQICAGKVQLDRPFEPLPATHPDYLDGEEDHAGRRGMYHAWVEFMVEGRLWVMDLTGDQFNPYLNQPLPGVLLVMEEQRPACYTLDRFWDWSEYVPTESDRQRVLEEAGVCR